MDRMIRKATYAGKVKTKDELDIKFWAEEKTVSERLAESWRLNCFNHNVSVDIRMKRVFNKAIKR